MNTITITDQAREVLWEMAKVSSTSTNPETKATFGRAMETILMGGYGNDLKVYRDGPLSLLCVWDQSFTLGIIWFESTQTWSQHS